MDGFEKQPHTGLTPTTTRPVAIVVGDPERATALAKLCDSYIALEGTREYRPYDVTYKGKHFTVISHGIGSAGATVCFEELFKTGAKCVIRAGTCGSLQPAAIRQGDMIVCYAAAAHSKVTELMVPEGFPAAANPRCHNILLNSAKKYFENTSSRVHEGVALSSDLFYQSKMFEDYLQRYQKSNVDVVEMEVGVLFILARIYHVKAASILAVDGCPFEWDKGNYMTTPAEFEKSKKIMLNTVLDAAFQIAETEL